MIPEWPRLVNGIGWEFNHCRLQNPASGPRWWIWGLWPNEEFMGPSRKHASTIKLPLSSNFMLQAVSTDGPIRIQTQMEIVSRDMVLGAWKQPAILALLCLTDHTLAKCGGGTMLVRLLTKSAASCVRIWEVAMTMLTGIQTMERHNGSLLHYPLSH